MSRFAILALAVLAASRTSAQLSSPYDSDFPAADQTESNPAASAASKKGRGKQSVEDVIPLTVGNLRGHKMLYSEGWYVVSSSSRAFAYAKQKSIVSSREAIRQAWSDASRQTNNFTQGLRGGLADSKKDGSSLLASGKENGVDIANTTHDLVRSEFAYAEDGFRKAAEPFVRGSVSIARRTEEDRRELAASPGNYFKNLKSDFSNIDECTAAARRRVAEKIGPVWEESFRRASREFKTEYDRSGEKKNTLAALGPILYGYLEAFYHGFAAPTAKTIVTTTVAGTSYAVFLPTAAAAVVAGRTVQSIGLTVYYAGKTGIEVFSPTVESGFFGAVSLLSLGGAALTEAGGGTLGAVNRVAFTAAAPVAASVEAVAAVSYHSAAYVGLLVSDAATGATSVLIDQGASGVVLGYNALTAVPAQAFLGTGDAAVFLAWDGPRLLIAAASGRLQSSSDHKSYSLGDLPAGTVVDMRELKRVEGVKIEAVSTDPAVIKQVLEKIPTDARGADASH